MTIKDVSTSGQSVVVRVDYNVPIDQARVTDDSRIRATLPTLDYLHQSGAKIILCSHFGRPNGKIVETERMRIVADHLRSITSIPVNYVQFTIGPEVNQAISELNQGDILLLENLRFHPGEEANDPSFAKQLSLLGTLFVNDAFGAAHRAHASTSGIAEFLPAVAGFLMEREITSLSKIVASPEKPVAAVIGGAKISDKIDILSNLINQVDYVLVGGGMVATFLKCQGYTTGSSMIEDTHLSTATRIINSARTKGVNLLLPTDLVVAESFSPEAPSTIVDIARIPDGWVIMDIGTETRSTFINTIEDCKTVLWNGPLGVFEWPKFAKGTCEVGEALAALDKAVTVIGGGSTVEAAKTCNISDMFNHVSTGGGATLEFLEGRTLPGVAAILDKNSTK